MIILSYIADIIDVAVIGGGHAGCEAALAAARMGMKTVLFAISLDSIAMMPCNPSIGGSSKGHLVREIDALGGEMGKNIDKTYIQTKMLNTAKGPAVYSLRAQADKVQYQLEMKHTLEKTENLRIRQDEIIELIVQDNMIKGVKTNGNSIYECKTVILCTGTYLKARCLYGDTITECGPNHLMAATKLSQCLKDLGIQLYRFKTGTPARMNKNSIDFSKMQPQYGDDNVVPFSFENTPEDIKRNQVLCWLTYTNEQTHDIIKQNLHRSPMYSGVIEGTGPRYCPSIEDKVVRFADKQRHQLFIEPEGENTEEMYIQGMSSSLPEDVQIAMYRTIPGLEHCEMTRNAYAIEYDCIDATQLKISLEFKNIKGLFSAGQFNGSSGYEEAAAQGLIAGINAVKYIKGESPIILKRSDAYIGVLIDDLVTKENHEPYRMMTSRAEYRLLLRQDNADLRLRAIGHQIGLVSDEEYEKVLKKEKNIESEIVRLENTNIGANALIQKFLESHGSTPLKTGATLAELVRRPELDYFMLAEIDPKMPKLSIDTKEQININIKYEGYIRRQKQQVAQFKKLENKKLNVEFDYSVVNSLRKEAVQKLNLYKPMSIGQASRISGVSPADISVLLVYLEQQRYMKERESSI